MMEKGAKCKGALVVATTLNSLARNYIEYSVLRQREDGSIQLF
jgi:hypothetical protein